MIAAMLSVIGYATLASSSERSANEVFVVPLAVPTYAATPVPTVGPATPSPSPTPDAVLDGSGHRQEAPIVSSPGIVEADELGVEGLAGAEGLDGIEAEFFRGYRDAGGVYSEAHVWRVIDCESLWNPLAGTRHLGLAQFSPGTWANVSGRTGLTDWTAAYDQGFNVAVWSKLVSPGTTAGWPVCWWV